MPLKNIKRALRRHQNKAKAKVLRRFFKTDPGEYAEGDIFLGVTVPVLRKLAKQFQGLKLKSVVELLRSPIHEERLLALLMLILEYRKSDADHKSRIYRIYLENTRYINNWDLVDATAKHIIGDFLRDKDKGILYELAGSLSLWDRRIAILSTFHFIENDQFEETLKIARLLVSDRHDLIHKAVGWMLREVGKRDLGTEEKFLKRHHKIMPRTMLRYAIEKFPESRRQMYLNKKDTQTLHIAAKGG
ncbi:MAG: DNA alkylation repair protein [Candidatus Omnitrophota bacterium]|nr:DNA alkylation repair protein [Candidatus Omnitrophota bacterium]